MAQQTAVSWLVKELNLEGYDYTISQAKAMEKEQLEQACIEVAEEAKKILREELKGLLVLPNPYNK